jgi:hypothetical protein
MNSLQRLAIALSLLPATLWAHPFGHHDAGFIMLREHVHTDAVSAWWVLVPLALAAALLHILGPWASGRAVRVFVLIVGGGAALLMG